MASQATNTVHPATLVDLHRYPVTDLDGDRSLEVIAGLRAGLSAKGVALLPGFVRPDAIEQMAREAAALETVAHREDVSGSPYIDLPDESYPVGHPRRADARTALWAVAYDLFPDGSRLRALYEWDPLMAFVGRILDRAPLYRYADPLGALNLAVMKHGDELGWHFDQTDFVVSLAIQSSVDGGHFDCAPLIRSVDDERYDEVGAVVRDETPERVERYPMTPGTLMIFEGRNSIHRVTPIVGDVARYVGLLAYDTKPGTNSSELLKLVRYGRSV